MNGHDGTRGSMFRPNKQYRRVIIGVVELAGGKGGGGFAVESRSPTLYYYSNEFDGYVQIAA